MHDCLVSESIIHSDRLTALQGVKGLVMVLSECPVGYPEVRLVVLVFFSHCLWHQVLCGCQLQTGQVRIVLLCCVVLLPSTPYRQLFEANSRIMFCISVHMLIIHYRSFAATSSTLVLSSYLYSPFKLCSRVVTCKEEEYILDWNSCC